MNSKSTLEFWQIIQLIAIDSDICNVGDFALWVSCSNREWSDLNDSRDVKRERVEFEHD
jgi:hypothetical protein